jgi:hypothetical protein
MSLESIAPHAMFDLAYAFDGFWLSSAINDFPYRNTRQGR